MRVLMLGTDSGTRGGIGSVVRNYMECGLMDRLGVRYIATHLDGTKLRKATFYITQFPSVIGGILASEVVHFHTSQGWSFRRLFLFFLIAKAVRKRTIWHVHGSSFDAYFRTALRFEKASVRFGLSNADAVIALSRSWSAQLSEIAPRARVRVIHNGVNVGKYEVDRSGRQSPMVVLFLGRLGNRKGVYDLIDAAFRLGQGGVRFAIAGDGDIDGAKAAVAKANLQGMIEILGWVDVERVVRLLKESDVYVLPSYDEGLPMGILEAMAAGLPIVSTPVGGIPDAVIDGVNGFLIQPGDSEGLAERILKFYSDPVFWADASRASRNRAAAQFSMDCVEGSLKALYAELR